MNMRPGRHPCITHISDDIATFDFLACFNIVSAHMSVKGLIIEAVVDQYAFSITLMNFCIYDFSVSRCIDRRTDGSGKIHPGMEFYRFINRVHPIAVGGRKTGTRIFK